jgi:hypothetical protein
MWARNGRELFYRARRDGSDLLMVVDIIMEPTFSSSRPRVLFQMDPYEISAVIRSYDVALDDKRFLLIKSDENDPIEKHVSQLNVILNWFEELKQRVPVEN